MSYIKNIKLESFNEITNSSFVFHTRWNSLKVKWSSLEKMLFKKYTLQGRVINKTNWGYLLGFFGYVGFISRSNTSKDLRLGETTYFNIVKLDYTGKSILLEIKEN